MLHAFFVIISLIPDCEHIKKEHATVEHTKVTSEKEYIEKLEKENSELKTELRSTKDDFERSSTIYKSELKLNIDIDMSKTREEYRRMKVENEKLVARNDTLYKLGNIALEKTSNRSEQEPSKATSGDDDIEVIEEEIIDIEKIVKDKLKGFRRTNPTTSHQAEWPEFQSSSFLRTNQ